MKIALINPPHPYLIHPDSQAPLGLLYIAAALRDAGHDVEFVNLSRYDEWRAIPHVPLDCDLYGFTATSVDYPRVEGMAKRLHELLPSAKIILGGAHATAAPELVDPDVFDAVCIGEGEEIILKIVADAERGHLAMVYQAERIRDLDRLPLPARDLLYAQGGDIFARGAHYGPATAGESTVIVSARGCPFNCAFCASEAIWGRCTTVRPACGVAAEVITVRDDLGVREFRFSDETFNLNRDRLRDLCRALTGLDVYWRASIRPGLSTVEDFSFMYDAGCREISAGVESGDQRVLDVLRKGLTVDDSREMCERATRAGLKVRLLLMTGCPGEAPDSPEITRDFLESVPFDLVALTQFRPLPGSPVWDDPSAFGVRIIDRALDHYNIYNWRRTLSQARSLAPSRSVIETDAMSREALEGNMDRMRQYVMDTGKCNMG